MRISAATLAASALLLTLESAVHAQASFAIRIGQPPPPRVYHVAPWPGPDFVWVEGYWYPHGGEYAWHDGYWTRPPNEGASWVEPYYIGDRYVAGYWDTPHGRVEHDHRWDGDRNRRDDRREEGREAWREDWREEHAEEHRGRR
jgi:hypothetical protein